MSRLHTVTNKAIAAGIITADPFAGYEPPRSERTRRYLTRGVAAADDYTAFCAEALPCSRPVFILLLYGYQLRRYVPIAPP